MREGRDVSELNGPLGRAWFAQWDFVIIRAFNERGRIDHRLDEYLAASAGVTRRGLYGWPIYGDDNYALGAALGQLARRVELGGCADYEIGGRTRYPTSIELADYLAGIASAGPVAWWYSNLSDYRRLTPAPDEPWWYANPSGNPAPRPPVMVQYAIIDGIDADRCIDADLAVLSGQPIPTPPEDDEMPIVIFGTDATNRQVAYLLQGGRAIVTWTQGPYVFGCPKGAKDYVDAHPGTVLQLATAPDLARVVVP